MNTYLSISLNKEILNQYKNVNDEPTVPLVCNHCSSVYYRSRKKVVQALSKKNLKNFCSKKCSDKSRFVAQIVQCFNCKTSFEKELCHIKTSPNHFCSRSCSATYNNQKRIHSDETKNKIAESLLGTKHPNVTVKAVDKYNNNPKKCVTCLGPIPYEMNRESRRTCSDECFQRARSQAGLKSASVRRVRSKDEIELFELCKVRFGNVEANFQLVDGWDVDILLSDYKIGILWNGPWHYKNIPGLKHSLKQTQNRDRIKTKLLTEAGYTVVVYRDDQFTPETAFKDICEKVCARLDSNQ